MLKSNSIKQLLFDDPSLSILLRTYSFRINLLVKYCVKLRYGDSVLLDKKKSATEGHVRL